MTDHRRTAKALSREAHGAPKQRSTLAAEPDDDFFHAYPELFDVATDAAARHRLSDADRDMVIDEAMSAAMASWSRLRKHSARHRRAWVGAVVRNRARSRLRTLARPRKLLLSSAPDSASTALHLVDLREQLLPVLRDLSVAEQESVLHTDYAASTAEEAAGLLGRAAATVRSTRRRTLSKLRLALEAEPL